MRPKNRALSALAAAIRMVGAFLPHLRPHRWQLTGVVVLGAIGSGAQAVAPFVGKYVVDEILGKRDLPLLYLFVGIYVAAVLIIQACRLLQSYLSLYVSSWVTWRLRSAYFRHLNSLSLEGLQKRRPGEHAFRITSDLSTVSDMILSIFPTLLNNVLSLAIAVTIMLRLRWELTAAYLAVIPAVVLFRLFSSTVLRPAQKRVRGTRERASGLLVEALRVLPLAKLFGREMREFHRYAGELKAQIRADFALWRKERALGQIQWVLESGPSLLLMCIAWYLVIRGSLTLGSALAFSLYFGMVLPPFLSFASVFQKMIAGLVPGERVLEFFRQPRERGRGLPRVRHAGGPAKIAFSGVSFSYGNGARVLEKADFCGRGGRPHRAERRRENDHSQPVLCPISCSGGRDNGGRPSPPVGRSPVGAAFGQRGCPGAAPFLGNDPRERTLWVLGHLR